jgi:hypothetical protein
MHQGQLPRQTFVASTYLVFSLPIRRFSLAQSISGGVGWHAFTGHRAGHGSSTVYFTLQSASTRVPRNSTDEATDREAMRPNRDSTTTA